MLELYLTLTLKMLFYLFLLIPANLVLTSDLCKSQSPCRCVLHNNDVIDISSVGFPEYPRFYEVSFDKPKCNTSELYSYNPCFAFASSDKHTLVKKGHKPCTGAAACIRTPGGSDGVLPEEYVIGLQTTASFWMSDKKYAINYTAPGVEKTLMVLLTCNEDNHHTLVVNEPNCSDKSEIVFELTSKCACPNKCLPTPSSESPTGMSVGSKLLIAFFTILLAYFVVGVFWNYCNGSQGAEIIPNLEFWNELPVLIMEGVVFSCSCCGRQSSYGEV